MVIENTLRASCQTPLGKWHRPMHPVEAEKPMQFVKIGALLGVEGLNRDGLCWGRAEIPCWE